MLKEVATKYKRDGADLVIAKMDATANDMPINFEVPGYPTLFFKAKGKPAVKFENGERTAAGITAFIETHRTRRDEL